MRTIIIIPAYNEEKSIYNVIMAIKQHELGVDVLVVNDGSNDNTSIEAQRAGAKVLNLSQNLGIGGAVQTGYLYALYNNYDVAVQIDADGQHDPCDLPKLLRLLEDGQADMVIGSRFLSQTSYKSSFFRKIGINYFSKLVSYIIKAPVYDTTSGYRAVNKKVIEIFARYYPSDYPEVESIVYAASKGIRLKEVSVNMKDRQAGKSSITPFKSVYYMIKVTLAVVIC